MVTDKEQILEQPTDDEQREQLSLINNDYAEVTVRNRKFKIRWLKGCQLEKMSRILLDKKGKDNKEETDGDILDVMIHDGKNACRIAAVYTLNNFFAMKLLYWLVWRWFYYIKQYSYMELNELLSVGKKKIPQIQFYAVTTLLIGAKATLMTMRAKEVEVFLQEQDTEQRLRNQKNGRG